MTNTTKLTRTYHFNSKVEVKLGKVLSKLKGRTIKQIAQRNGYTVEIIKRRPR